jgi:hypothetical protein
MIGRDLELLHIRKLLLQKEGFRVLTFSDPAELLDIGATVDLLILCHTVPGDDCELSLSIAASRWPEVKELVLVSWANVASCVHDAEQFFTIQGPEKLVTLVHELVRAVPLQPA